MTLVRQFWNALDFTSATSNAFFAFFCTALGYWMSVWWNRQQLEMSVSDERKSLYRSIGFFVADCMIAMRDAGVNLAKGMPPHRAIPCSGIEYFQVELMKHEKRELFVAVSALRSGIEQANHLVPVMIQEFTRFTVAGGTVAPDVLRSYCAETLRRYEDLRSHCEKLGEQIDFAMRDERPRGKKKPNQSARPNAHHSSFSTHDDRA